MDDKGNCLFDRSTDMQPIQYTDNVKDSLKEDSKGSEKPPQEGEEKGDPYECPVCKFMKAGPCNAEYLVWDDCMKEATEEDFSSKCFQVCNYQFSIYL